MNLLFVSISNGELLLEVEGEKVKKYPATKPGAKKACRFIQERGFTFFLCSSSIDCPTDYGAPDLDFRALLSGK